MEADRMIDSMSKRQLVELRELIDCRLDALEQVNNDITEEEREVYMSGRATDAFRMYRDRTRCDFFDTVESFKQATGKSISDVVRG